MSVQRPAPASPKRCSCQSMSGRSAWRLGAMMGRSHRDIPSAKTFATPRTCLTLKHRPLRISRQPSIGMSAPARGSCPPRHRLTQWTADILQPRIRILSPTYWGAVLASTVKAHAVTTLASNSSTSKHRSSLPYKCDRRRSWVSSSKSIRHHHPVSKQKPPIASPRRR